MKYKNIYGRLYMNGNVNGIWYFPSTLINSHGFWILDKHHDPFVRSQAQRLPCKSEVKILLICSYHMSNDDFTNVYFKYIYIPGTWNTHFKRWSWQKTAVWKWSFKDPGIYIYTVYYRWYILLNWFLSGDPTGMRIKPACLWVPRFEPYIATGLNIYICIIVHIYLSLFMFLITFS